jgi:flagellar basal body P-ring formation protein FlgA
MKAGATRGRLHETTDAGWKTVRPVSPAARLGLAGILLFVLSIHFTIPVSFAKELIDETPVIEKKLTSFIKQFYGEEGDLQIKFNTIPEYLKGNTKVKSISFARVPDAQGNGLCLVEFASKETRERNAYVAFKVFKKRALFVMKSTGKKGDILTASDIAEKDTFLTGATAYPGSRSEVIGKRLRKELPAGTVITSQVLEDQILVQTGEIVNVTAENPRLSIHTSGKALDRGKMGDTVRVKNLTSGKEIYGKVTGSSTVTVEF